MSLNAGGQVVADSWNWLALHYPYVRIDEWVLMPNHFHGIIVITADDGRGGSRTALSVRTITNRAVHEPPQQDISCNAFLSSSYCF